MIPSHTDNIRPISFLSNLSKIDEKIILKRSRNFADTNKLIPYQQFHFQPKYSTTTQQISRVADTATDNFNFNKHTGMVLLDVTKAFYTAWRYYLQNDFYQVSPLSN